MAHRVTTYDDAFKAAFLGLAEDLKTSGTLLEPASMFLELGVGIQMVADLHLEEVPRLAHAGLAQQLNEARQASINLARIEFQQHYGDQLAGLIIEPDLLRKRGMLELASELERKEELTIRESGRFFLVGRLTQLDNIIRFYLGINPDFERGRESELVELFCITAIADSEEFDFDEIVKPEFDNVLARNNVG